MTLFQIFSPNSNYSRRITQIRFLKYLLGVKNQTPTFAIYGETGRFPLSVICKEKSIKFWLKIMKNNELPISHMYQDLCNNVNKKCWASRLNSIIDHLGCTDIRMNFDPRINYFRILKTRIRDQFMQEWTETISSLPKLDQYSKYKTDFKFESYLNDIVNDKLRKGVTQLRLSSHSLEIEIGRYNNTPRMNRICKLCNQSAVESEFHFMLCCPLYSSLRQKFLGPSSWPTIHKFINLMSTKSKKRIINVAHYIKEAMVLRKNTLETLFVS